MTGDEDYCNSIPGLGRNGFVVVFILYSIFEIVVRAYVCKLLFNMAIKKDAILPHVKKS